MSNDNSRHEKLNGLQQVLSVMVGLEQRAAGTYMYYFNFLN